jgi:hypothetical protein
MALSLSTLPHDVKVNICDQLLQPGRDDCSPAARKTLGTLRLVRRDWSHAPIPELFRQLTFSVIHIDELRGLQTLSNLEHVGPHVKSLLLQIPLESNAASSMDTNKAGAGNFSFTLKPGAPWNVNWRFLSSQIEEAAAAVSEPSRLFFGASASSPLPVLSDLLRRVLSNLRNLKVMCIHATLPKLWSGYLDVSRPLTQIPRARREIGKAIWWGYARSPVTINGLVMADIDIPAFYAGRHMDYAYYAK